MFRSIPESGEGPLVWCQTSFFGRTFHILSGTDLVGTLRLLGFWERSATVESETGQWTLRRSGFFRRVVKVWDTHSAILLATFRSRWRGGILEFPDGHHFKWTRHGFWGQRWTFTRAGDQVLVGFRSGFTFLRDKGQIDVGASLTGHPDLPVLMFVGTYLAISESREAAAAAASGGASA